MQGKSSAINSLPEIIGIGQGSATNTAVMNQQNVPANNGNVTPVENRLSNYMTSSGETCTHSPSHDGQGFDSWNSGEPSSRHNMQNDADDERLKMEHVWSPLNTCSGYGLRIEESQFGVSNSLSPSHDGQSFDSWNSGEPSSRHNMQNDADDERLKMEHVWSPLNTCSGNGLRIEESQFGASNSLFRGRADVGSSSYQMRDRPFFSQGSTSNITYHNERLDTDYVGNNSRRLGVGSGCSNPYKSTQSETEQTSSASFCHNPSGVSDNMMVDSDCEPSSSGTWGLSCKRKSLEGTARQLYPGGSSSSFPQPEHGSLRAGTACFSPSSSLSLSTPAHGSPCTGLPEHRSSIINTVGMRTVSDVFPSSSVTNNFERPLRDLGRIATLRTSQDYLPVNILSVGSARHPNPTQFRDLAERPTASLAGNSGAPPLGLSHGNEVPGITRSTRFFSWDGNSTSRGESFSSSLLPGHRSLVREDLSIGRPSRNSAEHHILLPATETRNSTHDPTSWSLASGNVNNPFSPSTSRISPSSGVHSLPNPALIPPNLPRENQRRVLEFAPWSLFPSTDAESEVHSAHFSSLPSAPNSSRDATISSGPNSLRHHQSHPRSAFFLERLSDDISGTPHSLRALAADIEGRRQLITEIRQVLTAMRRAENLAAEDYMLFDPFIYHGMAEIHDRHRDMRLDVDNMSYEELLALEDRIGDVSTGVSEDMILKLMKQQKYELIKTPTPPDFEPCCICKEDYADADIIGTLDCGHNFHTNCIKQWLMLKNLCPICKTTALVS